MSDFDSDEEVFHRFSQLSTRSESPEVIEGEEDPFVRASHNHIRGAGLSPTKTNSGSVAYVVFNGRVKGVHYTWESCNHSVSGFRNQNFRGFPTVESAKQAWQEANEKAIVGDPPKGPTGCEKSASSFKHSQPKQQEIRGYGDLLVGGSSHIKQEQVAESARKMRRFWWVVVKGAAPGVYDNEADAKRAAGQHSLVRVERLGSKDKAEELWRLALSTGRVSLLPADQ
ncbi:hypothetical protein VNI00_017638 [Paramarasmius palmivorus]|uniref:Ribonuclease H1 N-terminal domain-containing protein n=1 Tax=Paramarasmius palmivorus TaxID=297713 RepID=A0AAW0B6X2_9AGAR